MRTAMQSTMWSYSNVQSVMTSLVQYDTFRIKVVSPRGLSSCNTDMCVGRSHFHLADPSVMGSGPTCAGASSSKGVTQREFELGA
jgi:hypothetical protein